MSTVAVEGRDAARAKGWTVWAGWLLSAMAVLVFLWSAYMKLTHQPAYVSEWERLGYSDSALTGIGLLQLACLAVYLIPRTSVLGVVLLTGYLGGAISSYVRIGEPYFANAFQISTALLAWGGIYLREERLQSVLPFRRDAAR
jgi:hypothetical protein